MSIKVNLDDFNHLPETTTKEMRDGDIAILINEECLVQRYYDNLIRIGESGGRGWSGHFPITGLQFKCKIIKRVNEK